MQIITMYLRADSVNGKLVDEFNQVINTVPAITRGMRAMLDLHLLYADGSPLDLSEYATWDFVIADDWQNSTAPQIHVTEGIITEGNEIGIPLTETNTEELIASLGNLESQTYGCELAGFEPGETVPGFLLQFNINIRNRRGSAGTGTPEPVGDGSYSAAQIRALFAARLEVQFSPDGENWTSTQSSGSVYYRFRNASAGMEWSDPLLLVAGPRGVAGSVEIGEVNTIGEGESAYITNSGDEHAAVLNFFLPAGPRGERATITVGSVETGDPENGAEVSNSGDEHDVVLDFVVPRGAKGDSGTIQIGSVSLGEPGTDPEVTNSGTDTDAVFDFVIPQGEKGDTGTITIGEVTTGAPGSDAEVTNSGSDSEAVLDFVIPQGAPGSNAFLYVAYASNTEGRGFSLTPSAELKYRAEIVSESELSPPVFGDFASAVWVKYLGDDGKTQGEVIASDQTTIVRNIQKIVFENATIRPGETGEVIVNFPEAPAADTQLNNYSTFPHGTLSAWLNGGGSQGRGLSRVLPCETLDAITVFISYSTFKGTM